MVLSRTSSATTQANKVRNARSRYLMIEIFNFLCYLSCLFYSFFFNGDCETKTFDDRHRGIYSDEVVNYEVVVPQRVDERGKFISNLIPHYYNKRSTKESDSVFYKLPIAGAECIVQLTPNLEFISPGAVVEIHGSDNERTSNESAGVESDRLLLNNLRIRRLNNADCHYSGVVRGVPSSKVALSTCFGLAGYIRTDDGMYTIEPVAEHDAYSDEEHPHILYKNDEDNYNWTVCNAIDSRETRRTVREAVKEGAGSEANVSTAPRPLYIETLIVVDKNLLSHHEDFDSENYVLTVFNMAFNLFHDASLGFPVKLSLVRIVRLEVPKDDMNVNANQDAIKTLNNFQNWQYRMNPGDDTHPNHHDVAVLLTRIDSYSNVTYGFLGVSTLGSACDKKLSAILCRDSGLRLGFVIAHEVAHLLGAEHDGFNNSCVGVDGEGFRTVMHPRILLTTETWSRCTQGYMKAFLESGSGNCLFDEPSEHHFSMQDLLPGTIYSADFQCKQLLTSTARECDEGSTCDSLNCQIPGNMCVMTKKPPASGTRCGENMWCRRGKCLMVGERPDAVDGNWGEWSPWSECSRSCGSGVSRSVRYCNRPVPSHGGKYCVGDSKRHKICSWKPCDMTQPTFRDIQCGEYDDWVYPEDGKTHTWKGYFYRDGNPCTLFCQNERMEVVALKPRVVDGTTCYKGIRDVCVDGTCRSIPCDLNLESNAVEDVCGVCHGDGTSCDFSQGQMSLAKFPKAITRLVAVPVGTRNIKVEEMLPSSARIMVRDKETKDFYLKGDKLGLYNVPGSQAWLGMLRAKQEALTIPGPVTKALTIWIERSENVSVKWSMALPTTQPRKPEFAWDYIRWSPCSTPCGPGIQKSEPSCMEEKAGLVESSYCSDLEMPPAKTRFCEVAKCEPRWMVTDWKGCENVSATKRVKRRIVHCVKTFGEGEGETSIIADEECPPPKPAEEEPCDGRHKRDSSHQSIAKKSASDGGGDDDDDDVSAFSSNRIKFGSHKKYDEYLKNFNAISTPQRKSETIPLHIVDTPHFKHYYRVLQTSENLPLESKIELNVKKLSNEANKGDESSRTKAKSLLEKIYKNTFSGNQMNYRGDARTGHRGRRVPQASREQGPTRTRAQSDELNKEKVWQRINFMKGKKISELKRKMSKAKEENAKVGDSLATSSFQDPGKPEGEDVFQQPPENYTIRFGQVLIDRDEDENLEVIFGDLDDANPRPQSDKEKVWSIRGDEAIQFLQNITELESISSNKPSDEGDKERTT